MGITVHVGNENSLFMTNKQAAIRQQQETKEQKGGKKTLFVGDLGVRPDSIALKRKQAQQRAMKVLSDTFESEKKIDQSFLELEEKKQQLMEENKKIYKDLSDLADEKQARMDSFAVNGSEEDSEYPLYLQDIKEYEEKESMYQDTLQKNLAQIQGITESVRDMKLERLKSDPMVEAGKQSEEVLMNANKEIFGDLINEGRKHIEEKMEEENEKAAKRAEKKEEEEEKLEKQEEKKESSEEIQEEIIEAATGEKKPGNDKELEEILNELKLIQEDLKGAAVDQDI